MPWRRIALHLPGVRADRQHDRLQRGVQVGADPGGDGGALARVGVQRLDAGERPGVDLAEVLVDRLDVRAGLLDRERDDQPAGEVHPAAAGGDELGRDRLELLAPAAGHDRVQPLRSRTGRRCTRRPARPRTAGRCTGTLVIARKPIAPGANGRRNRAAASAWVRAGAVGLMETGFVMGFLSEVMVCRAPLLGRVSSPGRVPARRDRGGRGGPSCGRSRRQVGSGWAGRHGEGGVDRRVAPGRHPCPIVLCTDDRRRVVSFVAPPGRLAACSR